MTKEKLIDNLRKRMDDYGWALDLKDTQKPVLESVEKDIDLLLEGMENCGGRQAPAAIDFDAIV